MTATVIRNARGELEFANVLRGDTLRYKFQLKRATSEDDPTPVPLDLTDYDILMDVRTSTRVETPPVLRFSTTPADGVPGSIKFGADGLSAADRSKGEFEIFKSAEEMDLKPFNQARFDVQLTKRSGADAGTVTTVLTGLFTLIQDASYRVEIDGGDGP